MRRAPPTSYSCHIYTLPYFQDNERLVRGVRTATGQVGKKRPQATAQRGVTTATGQVGKTRPQATGQEDAGTEELDKDEAYMHPRRALVSPRDSARRLCKTLPIRLARTFHSDGPCFVHAL